MLLSESVKKKNVWRVVRLNLPSSNNVYNVFSSGSVSIFYYLSFFKKVGHTASMAKIWLADLTYL